MSPSRRRLLQALVAALVLITVAVALPRLTGRGSGSIAPVRQDRPGRVLLVPGYGGSPGSLAALAAALRADGREVVVVALPGDGTGDLRQDARAVRAAAAGASSVDVVGYSAGGVAARYWVRSLGGDRVARRIVTLGAPQHGTAVASLGATFASGACPVACQQLVPGSPLLNALNDGDETPRGPQWLSLWTAQDDTVTPPSSARLAGAVNVVLQDVCPGEQIGHGDLPTTPLVIGIVREALGVAPLRRPTGCAALKAAGGVSS